MKTFFHAFQLKDERHLINVKGGSGTIPFPFRRKTEVPDEDEDGIVASIDDCSCDPVTKSSSSLSCGVIFQK